MKCPHVKTGEEGWFWKTEHSLPSGEKKKKTEIICGAMREPERQVEQRLGERIFQGGFMQKPS